MRGMTVAAATAVLLLTTAACGAGQPAKVGAGSPSAGVSSSASSSPTTSGVAMARPAALTRPTLSPDILVYGQDTLPAATLAAVHGVAGITDVESFSMASFFHEERQVTYAAVDPDSFRRFTPQTTAQSLSVWQRVAGGEMAMTQPVAEQVQDAGDYVQMGNDKGSPKVHIGAYAPLVQDYTGASVIDAVVNQKWASRLHMKTDNALLISTGATSPQQVLKTLKPIIGSLAGIRILAVNLPIDGFQTAVVTGGSITDALGTLRFRPNADGSVVLEPSWVAANIRTEQVPILGTVRCNKIMLPELRSALTEVVQRGLAGKIHVQQYGGCFVPRYIAGTHQLSFHTFGTAIDINVPENQRGTVGQMDRTVVSIFEKWGFVWGGDWNYTDPMHFELHRIVEARGGEAVVGR